VIAKSAAERRAANMPDYERARASFSWEDARKTEIAGLPAARGLNMAHEAVDRHAMGPLADRTALRWIARDGRIDEVSYDGLSRLSSRFAHVLGELGVERGETVSVLSGRTPELYVTVLGALKAGCVVSPLFSAFGPEPIRTRLAKGNTRVLVTTEELYRRKIEPIRDSLPGLRHVLLAGGTSSSPAALDLTRHMDAADDRFQIPPTKPEDPAILHFTSGTTGEPKGAIHVHGAILSHHVTGRLVLDLRPEDVFWCTADPGWVTGTSYGILAPLSIGVTSVVDEADFDPRRWYRILEEQRVTVWYTAPTAIRMLMRAGAGPRQGHDLSGLRFVASVGEPLDPEAVWWGAEALGRPIHDNWWQTETGGIMIANYRSMDIRPGSMGRPLPGIEAAIVRRDNGAVTVIEEEGKLGELALRPGWPSMFRGYLHDEARYRDCFSGGWYLTGDLARRDADDYFWFVGRTDDLIKTSGHFVGPFEVESVLVEHPAVAEAGAIGTPDPVAGEIVRAFVSLNRGWTGSPDLGLEILGFARRRLGAASSPKSVDFVESLPKNRAGKIMRRILKARALGLAEGDLSTLEPEAARSYNP
jgi:acetyl-CoA synthetase